MGDHRRRSTRRVRRATSHPQHVGKPRVIRTDIRTAGRVSQDATRRKRSAGRGPTTSQRIDREQLSSSRRNRPQPTRRVCRDRRAVQLRAHPERLRRPVRIRLRRSRRGNQPRRRSGPCPTKIGGKFHTSLSYSCQDLQPSRVERAFLCLLMKHLNPLPAHRLLPRPQSEPG